MGDSTVKREGSALVRFRAIDNQFRSVSVRELSDGSKEYYHVQKSEWFVLPEEWEEKIAWAKSTLKNTPWKLTQEQIDALGEYCKEHGINKSEAGRIALARLLEKKPKPKEIEAARVERGTNNLEEYNRRRAAGG